MLRDVKNFDKVILSTFSKQARGKEKGERRKEKGERRNSHAEKGDCVADERKRIKERPSGLVTLKPHKRSDLITS